MPFLGISEIYPFVSVSAFGGVFVPNRTETQKEGLLSYNGYDVYVG